MAWGGVLGILLFLLVGWNLLGVRQAYRVVVSDAIGLQRHLDRVDYLDVELTHAAFMAAATGSPHWEGVYRPLDAELTRTLAIVSKHARQVGAGSAAARIYENADSMARLEYRAFELVRAGRRAEAWSLLNGPGYRYYKRRYLVIAKEVRERLQAHIDAQTSLFYRRLTWVSALAVASLALLLITGFNAAVLTRRHLLRQRMDLRRREAAEDALKESEERFRLAARATNDLMYDLDLPADRLVWNEVVESTFGYGPDARVTGLAWWTERIHPDDSTRIRDGLTRALEGTAEVWVEEYRFRRADGVYLPVFDRGYIVRSREGAPVRMIGTMLDLSERRRAEEALRDNEERFRMLAEHSWDIVHVQDAETTIQYISPSVERMLGYRPEEMIGREGPEFVHPDDQPRALHAFAHEVLAPGAMVAVEIRLRHKDGSWRTVEAVAKNIARGGEPPRVVTYTHDVTERRRLEAELRRLALYDPLTGLPNRSLLTDRLDQAVRESHAGEVSALLFLDLDRFKRVNDSLGHSAGDLLLKEVARRLATTIGPRDTAARLGGDEFAVLIRGMQHEPELLALAGRVQRAIEEPVLLKGAEVTTSASAGIALLDGDHSSPEEVLRDADLALYSAKAQGRGHSAIFAPGMHADAVNLLETESALRGALERGEFRTCYQPIVSAETHQVAGWEALVRWQHPTRGLLGPAAFLPIAEDSGLVVQIDRWVLRGALRQLQAWQARSPAAGRWYVSVNLSGRQFYAPGLVEYVGEALDEVGLEPGSLHLEVTESILIDHASASETLAALKKLGVRIDLDDFGTGYSSLAYLHRFAVDGLKIDRSFVASLDEKPESRMIVRSVLALAGSLGLSATAEGVETRDVAMALRAEGCSHLQGYAFSRPMQPAEAETWLSSYVASA
jgi:diguanylate cyclase (GGDEF)-like protein/PAS domain S-box-containing protein